MPNGTGASSASSSSSSNAPPKAPSAARPNNLLGQLQAARTSARPNNLLTQLQAKRDQASAGAMSANNGAEPLTPTGRDRERDGGRREGPPARGGINLLGMLNKAGAPKSPTTTNSKFGGTPKRF